MSNALVSLSPKLWEIEEQYQALLDTEDLVPETALPEYRRELLQTGTAMQQKRENTARFMLFIDAHITAAKAAMKPHEEEISRLQRRVEHFESVKNRLAKYIVSIIKSFGKDKNGDYRKLNGYTTTMSITPLPESVDDYDPPAVPARFKRITVSMPVDVWDKLIAEKPELQLPQWTDVRIGKNAIVLDKVKISKAIESGTEVPGARLRPAGHDHRLEVK